MSCQLTLAKELRGASGKIELDIDTSLKSGALTVLFGKSGAGKSTILKMIAGLLNPTSGKIIIDNEVWFDSEKKINLPPQKRKVGFVFQDYALFPNMTVRQNLSYALEGKNDTKVEEILELTELTNLASAFPQTLSGGQSQRVALARALMREPKILLLDEPLSALDYAMRAKLQDELLRIQRHLKITTLLVSHDIAEVYKLSNHVIELEDGKIVKSASASEVFGGSALSAKFKFSAEILDISQSDIVFIVTLLVAHDIVKVVANAKEIENLFVGDRVILSSKAFNPLIIKV
ncbi:MAG: ATP-binding cassette domain-containing protein [Sulfurimonadaceae bacterium]|jgi:molybdate transport system ATP-binding protein|nr:ATP-binding cassette domain-containing protein [Sulfurimonadaceae bacterium]